MTPAHARRLALLACLLPPLGLGALVALRLPVPFALEWQEGGFLQQLERLRAGLPLYTRPDPSYAAFPYPPLFVWLAAAPAALFGAGLPALRCVSVAGTLLLLVSLYRLATRLSGDRLGGAVAVALLAAGYRASGAWLDLARVDALSLGLLALGLERLLWTEAAGTGAARPATARTLVGGLALAAAALAKQNALLLAPLLALALHRAPRRALVLLAAALLPVLVVAAWLERASDGWFLWTVVAQLSGHAWHPPALLGTWVELARDLPLALCLGVLVLVSGGDRGRERSPLLAAALVALLLMAWTARSHSGGYDNTLLPAHLAAALWIGTVLPRWFAGPRAGLALVALVAQLLWLGLDRRPLLPTAEQVEQARIVAQRLAGADGPVLAPSCPELAPRTVPGAGGVHGMAVIDLLRSGDDRRAADFVARLEEDLVARRFALVLVPPSWTRDLPLLEEHYRAVEELVLEHATGAAQGPLILLVPRP